MVKNTSITAAQLIEKILADSAGAYYFKLFYGDFTDGQVECVIIGGVDDEFIADGYKFSVRSHIQENINDDDTNPETNGGYIDIPIHDIYVLDYEKIAK